MSEIPLDFVQIAPNVWQKWNPVLGIRTTLKRDGDLYHVRHEQPKQNIQAILDLNVKQQNDRVGPIAYGDHMYQATRIPLVMHSQIMKMCGHKPGQGYDVQKFKKIMNDSDYSKLRCISGKL